MEGRGKSSMSGESCQRRRKEREKISLRDDDDSRDRIKNRRERSVGLETEGMMSERELQSVLERFEDRVPCDDQSEGSAFSSEAPPTDLSSSPPPPPPARMRQMRMTENIETKQQTKTQTNDIIATTTCKQLVQTESENNRQKSETQGVGDFANHSLVAEVCDISKSDSILNVCENGFQRFCENDISEQKILQRDNLKGDGSREEVKEEEEEKEENKKEEEEREKEEKKKEEEERERDLRKRLTQRFTETLISENAEEVGRGGEAGGGGEGGRGVGEGGGVGGGEDIGGGGDKAEEDEDEECFQVLGKLEVGGKKKGTIRIKLKSHGKENSCQEDGVGGGEGRGGEGRGGGGGEEIGEQRGEEEERREETDKKQEEEEESEERLSPDLSSRSKQGEHKRKKEKKKKKHKKDSKKKSHRHRHKSRRTVSRSRSRSHSRDRSPSHSRDRSRSHSRTRRSRKRRRQSPFHSSRKWSRSDSNSSAWSSSRTRSRSPYHSSKRRTCRSKSRSPFYSRRRSRSRSPVHSRHHSRSRSPVHSRHHSRSRSPVHSRHRRRSRDRGGRSPSPFRSRYNKKSNFSRSHRVQRSRSRSRSPLRRNVVSSSSSLKLSSRREEGRGGGGGEGGGGGGEEGEREGPQSIQTWTTTRTDTPSEKMEELAERGGKKEISKFTNFCKNLQKRQLNEDEGNEPVTAEPSQPIRAPFILNQHPNPQLQAGLVFHKNAWKTPNQLMEEANADLKQKPVEVQYPVSHGINHRQQENTFGNVKDVFAGQKSTSNVSELMAQRLQATQALQSDPGDPVAKQVMAYVEQQANKWATCSTPTPGKFTGHKALNALTKVDHGTGMQAWAKKNMFLGLAPVCSGFGVKMLRKMGWNFGQPLGKSGAGVTEPIPMQVKVDRAGLISAFEKKGSSSSSSSPFFPNSSLPSSASSPAVSMVDGKHPVCVLQEVCSKKHWKMPYYELISAGGPSHKMTFLYQVTLPSGMFKPALASPSKKNAKAQAAMACLEGLGLVAMGDKGKGWTLKPI